MMTSSILHRTCFLMACAYTVLSSDEDSDNSLCSDEDEAAASQIQESHRVPNNHFGLDQSMKMALGFRGMHTPNRKRNDAQPSSAKLIRVTNNNVPN